MIELSREFQVLASHLNFTTAARELNISQPGLSRHIGELEQMLGFRLLERNPVRLTVAGNHYLEGISQVVERVDGLVEECKALSVRDCGAFTVSMIAAGDVTTLMVYDTLSYLSDAYPDFTYRFDADRQTTIKTAVASGAADVGVIYHQPVELPDDLVVEHMFDEPFAAWIHRENPLAGKPVTLADLSACTVVLSANRKFQTWVEGMKAACDRYGCAPQFRMKNVDTLADFFVSLQRDETVFVSTSLDDYPPRVNSRLCRADLVLPDGIEPTYPVNLIYRPKSLNPMVGAFVERFRELSAAKRQAGTEEWDGRYPTPCR